jgi:adenylate cyclase
MAREFVFVLFSAFFSRSGDLAEGRVERRSAAILASDVAGYSRLAGAEEELTLARLRALRSDLIDPIVAVHNGRIVKRTGDGALVEFRSVVDAVRCAIEAQNGMAERNAGLPQERRIEFRIGIHLGDVVEEADGDLMGDGVNIAARLETVAEPGGICLSHAAYEQVRDKLKEEFVDLGDQQLKNIARPVRVYRIALGADTAAQAPTLPDRPSIAVLPFSNMSGDAEQEYFCDGMVEDIITGLSRIKWLFVIARNSSFTYKGRAVDVRQVARELGARYVLEGSVRKATARLRITAQLIDTATGAHIWADRFDGAIEDVFELQDQVTASVIGAIEPALAVAVAEIARVKAKPTASLDAYDLFLRAFAALRLLTKPATEECLALCRRAIALDPRYASAYGLTSWGSLQLMAHGWGTPEDRAAGAEFAAKAVECGGDDPAALAMAGQALTQLAGDPDRGAAAIGRSLQLNPNSATALMFSAFTRCFVGEPEVAIEHGLRAMRLSPLDPLGYRTKTALATGYLIAGRPADAIPWTDKALYEQPAFQPALLCKIAACVAAGRLDEAREAGRRMMAADPDLTIDMRMRIMPLKRPQDRALFVDGLRQAGVPE